MGEAALFFDVFSGTVSALLDAGFGVEDGF
jgi:hypothetical protein